MVSPDVAEYNLHPMAIIVMPIPLAILASIALSIRLWVRCCLVRSFGRDDVFLILAHVRRTIRLESQSHSDSFSADLLSRCLWNLHGHWSDRMDPRS